LNRAWSYGRIARLAATVVSALLVAIVLFRASFYFVSKVRYSSQIKRYGDSVQFAEALLERVRTDGVNAAAGSIYEAREPSEAFWKSGVLITALLTTSVTPRFLGKAQMIYGPKKTTVMLALDFEDSIRYVDTLSYTLANTPVLDTAWYGAYLLDLVEEGSDWRVLGGRPKMW